MELKDGISPKELVSEGTEGEIIVVGIPRVVEVFVVVEVVVVEGEVVEKLDFGSLRQV